MKLRSGRVVSTFPTKLDKALESGLQEFKILFAGNPQHGKELLELISVANSIDIRFAIRDKIGQLYNDKVISTNLLQASAGQLASLLIHCSDEHHEIIAERIKNFDIESHLMGSIEE